MNMMITWFLLEACVANFLSGRYGDLHRNGENEGGEEL